MDSNPYDFPMHIGPCERCKKQDAPVIGCVCVSCMTDAEKKSYGIDQETGQWQFYEE